MKRKIPIIILFYSIIVSLLNCSSEKRFPNINYDNPNWYLTQPVGIGSQAFIDSVAATITGATQEDILANIWYYIQDNLTYKTFNPEEENYRNFEQLVRDREYTGSATHSILFGTLCRAKGIPVVWVKSVDYKWIADFLEQGTVISYFSAYTYLECYVDNVWKLVDAYSGKIYDQHDTQNPNLPDNRYGFEKGADPNVLVLDTKWEEWKKGVITAFQGFSLKKLEPLAAVERDFLLKRFKGRRPSIGVKIQNTEDREGVMVIHVKRDFPADKAGILPGDIITLVGDEKITDIFQLVEIIKRKGFDSRFRVKIRRDNQEMFLPFHIPAP